MVHFSSYVDYGFDFYDNTTVPFRIFKKKRCVLSLGEQILGFLRY